MDHTNTHDNAPKRSSVVVWDPFVRLFHWSLVLSVFTAWWTGDDYKSLHLASGYVAGGLIVARLLWGFFGPRYARFSQFVRGPGVVVGYLKAMMRGQVPRYLGHNPAGGAMIVALLTILSGVGFTGWLLTTDAFWGTVTMERIHETLVDIVLALVCVHVLGVIVMSTKHGENLVRSMLTGRKRRPNSGDVA